MNTVTYQVPGISCGHCVNTIEAELVELKGVINVKADAALKSVLINYQEPASEKQLKELLSEINYPVQES
jgi:copper chaperone